jgi:trimeric autotransporter adhesin
MKKPILLLMILLTSAVAPGQGVAINETGAESDPSAMLEVTSSDKGILIPRITQAQRDAISNPATGLLIYQTDETPGFYYNEGSPAVPLWTRIGEDLSQVTGQWEKSFDNIFYTQGFVGIGTANPEAILDVSGGDALIQGMTVGRGGGGQEQNTVFGSHAMRYNTDGDRNTAIGYWSMFGNYTGGGDGEDNTAMGWSTLSNSATGSRNIAMGSSALTTNYGGHNNIAVGYQTLVSNSTGNSNVAIGTRALFENTDRSNLVAVGDSALFHNGQGATVSIHSTNNTAVGSKTLYGNTTGFKNTALGFQALMLNTIGEENTANGSYALIGNISGSRNTALGSQALSMNTSGNRNVAIGYRAMENNTTGNENLALGTEALVLNKVNTRITAIGVEAMYYTDPRTSNGRATYNTAVGYFALRGQVLTSMEGRWNTAVGDEALTNNKNGNHNTAIGASALASNGMAGTQTWHSSGNTAVGSKALLENTSGYYNTALGVDALSQNTTGFGNTVSGYQAAMSNETGNFNSAFGFGALSSNNTGNNNTAIGRQTMSFNTSGYSNVAIGASALSRNTDRNNLVAIGDSALLNNGLNASEGIHATRNTAVGSKALLTNTTGYYNTASGFGALGNNSTGYHNTAIGANTLDVNSTGFKNVAVGTNAMSTSNGNDNAALGYKALSNNTSGHKNVAIGSEAMGGLIFSEAIHSNIAIGFKAGHEMVSSGNIVIGEETGKFLYGNNNVWIGNGIGPSGSSVQNTIVLGTNTSIPTLSNRVFVGNGSMQWIGGQVSWSTYSDNRAKRNVRDDIPGLAFIMKLNPVSYNWSVDAMNQLLGIDHAYTGEGYKDIEQQRISGFLAQEVEVAARASGYDFSGVQKSGDVYSLSYAEFVVPLVKAVQELNERNDQLNNMVEMLLARILALENSLNE